VQKHRSSPWHASSQIVESQNAVTGTRPAAEFGRLAIGEQADAVAETWWVDKTQRRFRGVDIRG
jgi:hypothetical protein